jgi:hypothetical protein
MAKKRDLPFLRRPLARLRPGNEGGSVRKREEKRKTSLLAVAMKNAL